MRKMKEEKKSKPEVDVVWMKGMTKADKTENDYKQSKSESNQLKYIKIDIRVPKVKVIDTNINNEQQIETININDQKNYQEYYNAHKMMVLMDVYII